MTSWYLFFFFKQKTAYEIYQCDWSSDVCSSDLNTNAAEVTILPGSGYPGILLDNYFNIKPNNSDW